MAERAHHHVALAHLGHAAARELQRVVGGLVVQHLDDDDHAFFSGDLVRDSHLVRQADGLGNRSNLVDHNTAHCHLTTSFTSFARDYVVEDERRPNSGAERR